MEPFYRLIPLLFGVNKLLSQIYGASAGRITRNIYRAYVALKMDDVLRDERSRFRRFTASIVRRSCAMRLPSELEDLVRDSSGEVEKLEASGAGLDEYVEGLSEIGGKIFSYGAKREERRFLWGLGSSIVAVMTIRDMIRDRRSDTRSGTYNPLKNCPFDRATKLLRKYYSELSNHLQLHKGLLLYAPRGRGVCGGWSQMMFCYMICETLYEDMGLMAPE